MTSNSALSPASAVASREWEALFGLGSPASAAVLSPAPTQARNPQVPTPPSSDKDELEQNEGKDALVSVSAAFHPGAQLENLAPDVTIISSDSVWFSVHSHRLSASSNQFNGALNRPGNPENPPTIPLREGSAELNVILHTLYNMSAALYSPSPSTISAAFVAMRKYGLDPAAYTTPHSPLYTLVLGIASSNPFECFALAAENDLRDLAVAVSAFLLTCSLSEITDEQATRIGPLYLKRLFFLHLGRMEALKRILLPPPVSHPPSMACDFVGQKRLTRAWALATAYLAWEAKPDISTSSIEAALRPLGEHLGCEQCEGLLKERINNLVVQWSLVKRTI